ARPASGLARDPPSASFRLLGGRAHEGIVQRLQRRKEIVHSCGTRGNVEHDGDYLASHPQRHRDRRARFGTSHHRSTPSTIFPRGRARMVAAISLTSPSNLAGCTTFISFPGVAPLDRAETASYPTCCVH